jgi:hypothetical protein
MNIIRTCKPGSEWTLNELNSYRIVVRNQDEVDFFNRSLDNEDISDVPKDVLESELILERIREASRDDGSYNLLKYIRLAARVHEKEESAVDDFSVELLRILKYDKIGTIRTRKDILLLMCGTYTHAKTDVCLMDDEEDIFLLIQEDKSHISISDPEAQVIAEAIAAFQHNNRVRQRLNINALDEYTFPCVTMTGTRPIFYKVRVTTHLSNCVQAGIYPDEDTVVYRFNPIPGFYDGMVNINDRQRLIRCFKIFKRFIKFD